MHCQTLVNHPGKVVIGSLERLVVSNAQLKKYSHSVWSFVTAYSHRPDIDSEWRDRVTKTHRRLKLAKP